MITILFSLLTVIIALSIEDIHNARGVYIIDNKHYVDVYIAYEPEGYSDELRQQDGLIIKAYAGNRSRGLSYHSTNYTINANDTELEPPQQELFDRALRESTAIIDYNQNPLVPLDSDSL